MARWVTISTIRWQNTGNDLRKGPERVREIWDLLIDQAALDKPDLLLMPETFLVSGLKEREAGAEPVPGGATATWLAGKARQYRTYLFAGILRKDEQGRRTNSAVLFDRSGALAGVYDKLFPTPGEMEEVGRFPGLEPKTFDCDFGRIAGAICFDLNFRELFAEYHARGVELCCFLSAMPGGLHLQTIAREYRMHVASSAREWISYIINPLGTVLAATSMHAHTVSARVNLDVALFHMHGPDAAKFLEMRKKYGPGVVVELASPEHWKMLRCDLPDKTAAELAAEYGIETLDAYLARTRRIRRERLAGAAGAWLGGAPSGPACA